MNLADMRFRVRELAGLAETEWDTSPADIDLYLNSAYSGLMGMHPWPFLEQTLQVETAAGERDYVPAALPDGSTVRHVRGVLLVEQGQERRLRPRSRTVFDSVRDVPSGMPTEYAVLPGKGIRLMPTPDDEWGMAVEVTVTPPPLREMSDVPVFDVSYHEILPLYAASRVLRRRRADGDVGRANDLDEEASSHVARMVYELLGDHDRSPAVHGGRRVVRRPGPPLGVNRGGR